MRGILGHKMIKFALPIYFRNGSKDVLVGANSFRNMHFHLKNKLKKHYHKLVADKLSEFESINGQFKTRYTYYYKNPSSDASNVVSQIEKFMLDALIEINLVANDNVKYHIGSSWKVGGQDKEFPRIEIEIQGVEDESM